MHIDEVVDIHKLVLVINTNFGENLWWFFFREKIFNMNSAGMNGVWLCFVVIYGKFIIRLDVIMYFKGGLLKSFVEFIHDVFINLKNFLIKFLFFFWMYLSLSLLFLLRFKVFFKREGFWRGLWKKNTKLLDPIFTWRSFFWAGKFFWGLRSSSLIEFQRRKVSICFDFFWLLLLLEFLSNQII